MTGGKFDSTLNTVSRTSPNRKLSAAGLQMIYDHSVKHPVAMPTQPPPQEQQPQPKEVMFVTRGPKNLSKEKSKIISKYNNMINVDSYK